MIMRWCQDFCSNRNVLYFESINVTILNIIISMILQDITMEDIGYRGHRVSLDCILQLYLKFAAIWKRFQNTNVVNSVWLESL